MALSKNKILLLVEGYKTEPYLMEMYADALKEDFELNVVSFGTNIYVLYQSIKALNSQFGSDSPCCFWLYKIPWRFPFCWNFPIDVLVWGTPLSEMATQARLVGRVFLTAVVSWSAQKSPQCPQFLNLHTLLESG